MQTLNNIDYEILAYVRKNEPVTTEQIKTKFHKVSSIEQRLSVLSKNKISDFGNPIANSSLIIEDTNIVGEGIHRRMEHLGIYHASDEAKILLQNHKRETRKHNKELWLVNVKMPIITAFVTTLLTLAITHLLLTKLPEMIQWFADILSKFHK